jgi:RecA-family ATPase
MAHQLHQLFRAAEAWRHLQHAGHAVLQGVVQHIAADPQQARHQPVLAVGQQQVIYVEVVVIAAER